MIYYPLNEIEIVSLQLDKRNTYLEMLKLINQDKLLHVVTKEIANTAYDNTLEALPILGEIK